MRAHSWNDENNHREESHPFLKKNRGKKDVGLGRVGKKTQGENHHKFGGGKKSAFSAAKKSPIVPLFTETAVDEPTETKDETSTSPPPLGYICTNHFSAEPACPLLAETTTTSQTATCTTPTEADSDPPTFLPISPSGESDEDSFYYQIRGKQHDQHDSERNDDDNRRKNSHGSTANAVTCATFTASFQKPKVTSNFRNHNHHQNHLYESKNPYAFPNHPLLPIVPEEGNISPFPTCWDSGEEVMLVEKENHEEVTNDGMDGDRLHSDANDSRRETHNDVAPLSSYMRPMATVAAATMTSKDGSCTSSTTSTAPTVVVANRAAGLFDALPVFVSPESLAINRRDPTCWQLIRHRLRRTKGLF